jgi:DNA-binding NarL/FixJ family response regulator
MRHRPRRTSRLRISPAQWRRAVTGLGFSTQQARLVRLMLDGKKDKQIAEGMKLSPPTVRTYLSRLFQRTGARDRVGLLLHVFAYLMDDCRRNERHHK